MPNIITRGAMSAKALGFTSSTGPQAVYVEDVFSTYLYNGNNSTQTITNNIDLSTKGGLLWIRDRNGASHALFDTIRGTNSILSSNTTSAVTINDPGWGISSFNTNGWSFANGSSYVSINNNSTPYVSWAFRKQEKFSDIVSWTGDGVNGRSIAHNLGSAPGLIIIKRTDTSSNWKAYHTNANASFLLNTSDPGDSAPVFANGYIGGGPTSTQFQVYQYAGSMTDVNASGGTYIAYLYAGSNAGGFGINGTDSVIACGNFTTDGSGRIGTVTLGWEPQFILLKSYTNTQGWFIFDTMRGLCTTAQFYLQPNTSGSEGSYTDSTYVYPTATGFGGSANFFGANNTMIYMAIRRGPMKVPTDATKVFLPTNVTSDTTTTTGFPVDWSIAKFTGGADGYATPRLTNAYMVPNNTNGESGNLSTAINLQSNTSITYAGIFGGGARTLYLSLIHI